MADTTIVEYIKTAQAAGTAKEVIYRELLDKGNSIDSIQEAYISILSESDKVDTSKKTIRLIVAIAILLIGAGIFSFIAANWRLMPATLKIFIIVGSMLASYGAGWYFKEKAKLTRTGNGLIILGSVIYGAGIFLVAQIFHIQSNWNDGFVLWMLGTLAMAYASDVFSLFVLAIPLGIIVCFGYPTGLMEYGRVTQFNLSSTLLLIISTIVLFDAGLRLRKRVPKEAKESN